MNVSQRSIFDNPSPAWVQRVWECHRIDSHQSSWAVASEMDLLGCKSARTTRSGRFEYRNRLSKNFSRGHIFPNSTRQQELKLSLRQSFPPLISHMLKDVQINSYPMARRVSSQAINEVAAAAVRLSPLLTRTWWRPANTEAKPTMQATSAPVRKVAVTILPAPHEKHTSQLLSWQK